MRLLIAKLYCFIVHTTYYINLLVNEPHTDCLINSVVTTSIYPIYRNKVNDNQISFFCVNGCLVSQHTKGCHLSFFHCYKGIVSRLNTSFSLNFRWFNVHEALVLILRLLYALVAGLGARGDRGLVQSLAETGDDLFQVFALLLDRQRFLGDTMYPPFVV